MKTHRKWLFIGITLVVANIAFAHSGIMPPNDQYTQIHWLISGISAATAALGANMVFFGLWR